MDTTALRSLFGDLRPRIPDHALYELAKFLQDDPIVHAQAQWDDPGDERGLTCDVFTKKHRIHVSLATNPSPLVVSVTPLIFTRIRCEDEDVVVFLRDDEVRMYRSQRGDHGRQVRQATAEPEVFAMWAIRHGTWA